MEKKHVIITGGAKGIGEACSRLFLANDFLVTILDIDRQAGTSLSHELGPSSFFIFADVSQGKSVSEAILRAINNFGDVDVLVNNAGIVEYGTITQTTDEMWDRTINVNLKSHFLCARACIPSMLKKERGVIINVSSVQAFICQTQVAAYVSSKSALLGLTRSIAVDYGPKIRCVAICPGTVDTPMLQEAIKESGNPEKVLMECDNMHLTKRIGTAEEIAELIMYVSSEKAAFITGQALRIDGGLGIKVAGSKQE